MARDVIERKLTAAKTSRVSFDVASEEDDADIRRLLRANQMPGRISLALEREPNYFADANLPGETRQTIVARDNGRIVCVGSCTIRQRFINGQPCRVGYLGGLRLDATQAGRFDVLRRGYEFFHDLQADAPADFYFTSIAADNERARTLLERGLPGMPSYELIGEYVTVLLSAKSRHSVGKNEANIAPSAEQFISLVNNHNREQQFAPCWSENELSALQPQGLKLEDFYFIHEDESIIASAALWNQTVFKQTVVRGYTPSLTLARPALNLIARITRGTRLPAVGETLANAFVSHLAITPDKPDTLTRLLTKLREIAAQRKIELLTLGFAANDPRLTLLRKYFRCHEYHSRLYIVRWPDCGGVAQKLDGRILAPEVALL